jgi:undecaprenyl-diphosphatase
MLAPGALTAVDALITGFSTPLQTLRGVEIFLVITALGGGVGIIAVAVGFAYIARLSTSSVLRLTLLMLGVLVTNRVAKEFFARARPDALSWLAALPSFSFPSAHATSALALYGFVAVVLYRRTRRMSVVLLPAVIVLLVGMSRIVLAAHYFTDVLGGYLLGLALLAFAFALPLERLIKRYA